MSEAERLVRSLSGVRPAEEVGFAAMRTERRVEAVAGAPLVVRRELQLRREAIQICVTHRGPSEPVPERSTSARDTLFG